MISDLKQGQQEQNKTIVELKQGQQEQNKEIAELKQEIIRLRGVIDIGSREARTSTNPSKNQAPCESNRSTLDPEAPKKCTNLHNSSKQTPDSTRKEAIQPPAPPPLGQANDYVPVGNPKPTLRQVRKLHAWDPTSKIKENIVARANKFLRHEDIGFQLNAQQRKLMDKALSVSELAEPEGKVMETSLCRLKDASLASMHKATNEYRMAKDATTPQTIETYLNSFKLFVKAEVDRRKHSYAQFFLMGLALEHGPMDKNREIKAESELELQLPTDIFDDLMEGRKDVSRFPAFHALWPFSNLHKAEIGARNTPTKQIFPQPLPREIKIKQPGEKRKWSDDASCITENFNIKAPKI